MIGPKIDCFTLTSFEPVVFRLRISPFEMGNFERRARDRGAGRVPGGLTHLRVAVTVVSSVATPSESSYNGCFDSMMLF